MNIEHTMSQIYSVADIFRDALGTSLRVWDTQPNLTGNTGNSSVMNTSASTGVPGIGTPTHAIEQCMIGDLSVCLTRLVLREKVRRAEQEVMAFEREQTSLSSNIQTDNSTNSHAHTHSHSNLYGTRVEKQPSSASASDGRLALNFGSNSPHPHPQTQTRIPQGTKPLARHVTLVMVDSVNAISSEKDRDRPVSGGRAIAAQAAKEKIQVERKVHAFALAMWGTVTLVVTQSLRVRGNHTVSLSATQAQQDGVVVISCEAPFCLVRELGSVITRLCSTSQLSSHHQSPLLGGPNHSLIGAFCSSSAAAPYKRSLKAVVAELSYAPTPLQHQLKAISSSSSSSSVAITTGAVSAQAPSQTQTPQGQTPSSLTPLRDAFIYSVIDDKFDFISYSPSILSRGI